MIARRNFVLLLSTLVAITLPLMGTTSSAWAADEATVQLNALRAQNGRSPLSPGSDLQKMAQYQADLMAEKSTMGHSVGWGNGFTARLRKFNIHGIAGENVAAGQKDIPSVYRAWMNSPGHRKNMLDPAFQHYGFAKAANPQKPQYYYWAIVFGK